MSTRTIRVCDICHQDVPDGERAYRFQAAFATQQADVGSCCLRRPIADLSAAFKALAMAKAASA